ncbi:hypothetical protein [Pseudomonas sp. CMR5c]|uniref:hypothetical protein n=1 Tax=Pseudomonas sp. CMR5c TaxID=658630 RepID=UPI00069FF1B9|nr:hypothetical protein [Pseudomonas sp. CMR5c]AZC19583.1 hypothetical protein C4K40_4202 [Pseudomonas sp. CMR5c]
MPNNERLVAQLQEDLNTRDQALDDAATENDERELSRRDWFDEAQRLQAKLAERDALLRDAHEELVSRDSPVGRRITAALSASAEPKSCGACAGCEDGCRVDRESPPPPLERDERAEFETWAGDVVPGLWPFDKYNSGDFRNENLQRYWMGWQARAALDCPDCGDTGVEPCSKHGWKP